MATVTVNQLSNAGTAQLRLACLPAQRMLRSSTTNNNTTMGILAEGVDLWTYHWSGGYQNSNEGTQMLSTHDVAPGPTLADRSYTGSSYRWMDKMFADLDTFIALRPGAKIALILWDFPVAMLAGRTRSSRTDFSYPSASLWGSSGAGNIATSIINRYGQSKILGFSFGQEKKGWPSISTTTEWNTHIDFLVSCFTTFATYMRANHPTCELWWPHFNYLASHGDVNGKRKTAVNNMIAGGTTLEATDEIVINRFISQVNPAHVDRMTYDISIIDFNTSDSWRGDYNTVKTKVDLEYHLARILKAKMVAAWGAAKPLVAIETYVDVNQQDQDWMNVIPGQTEALHTAVLMAAQRGGVTYHHRWDGYGATPGAEAPNGDIAGWLDRNAVRRPAWDYARDLRNAIPPGTTLFDVVSDDPDIKANAAGDKCFIVNLSGSTKTVTVQGSSAAAAPVDIAAYQRTTVTLPTVTGGGGGSKKTPALVQQSPGSFNTGGLTTAPTLPDPATAGNALVLGVDSNQNGGVTSLTTPAGYTPLKEYAGASGAPPRIAWYGKIAAGGETTATATHSATGQRLNAWLGEFSNIKNPLTQDGPGGQASSDAATSNALDCGSITTTLQNSLILAAVGQENIGTIGEGGNGFTPATVVQEGGTASNQRNAFGVYYKVANGGTYREQPSSTVIQQYTGVTVALEAADQSASFVDFSLLSMDGVGAFTFDMDFIAAPPPAVPARGARGRLVASSGIRGRLVE